MSASCAQIGALLLLSLTPVRAMVGKVPELVAVKTLNVVQIPCFSTCIDKGELVGFNIDRSTSRLAALEDVVSCMNTRWVVVIPIEKTVS